MQGIVGAIFDPFITLILIALLAGGAIVGGIWWATDADHIESKTLIAPEIRLTTDGATIDTVYIYRTPDEK